MNNCKIRFEQAKGFIIPGGNNVVEHPSLSELDIFQNKMNDLYGKYCSEINSQNGFIRWEINQGKIDGKLVNVSPELLDKITESL